MKTVSHVIERVRGRQQTVTEEQRAWGDEWCHRVQLAGPLLAADRSRIAVSPRPQAARKNDRGKALAMVSSLSHDQTPAWRELAEFSRTRRDVDGFSRLVRTGRGMFRAGAFPQNQGYAEQDQAAPNNARATKSARHDPTEGTRAAADEEI